MGSELWQAGPSWLRESEEKWPRTPLGEPRDCQTEERKSPPEISVCVTLTTTQGIANLLQLEDYSSLRKLHRVTAWIPRISNKLLRRSQQTGEPTSEELSEAERRWILEVQKQSFREEHDSLERAENILKTSRLYELNSFLEENTMRIKGRIQESHLTYDEKHPVLLPTDHRYVQL